MCRVAIYVRYPFANDGGTNDLQKLKDFVATKKKWELKEVFQDLNCSEKMEKPEFERLLNLCSQKEFDIILVLGIYHITRDTIEFLKLEKLLMENGVKIYSKSENSYIEIYDLLNNKSLETLINFLSLNATEEEKIIERYIEMQLRLETLQKIRWSVGEHLVELKDKDYLIEAYEILNDSEKNIWKYINEGQF